MKRLLLVFGILVSGHVFAASSDMEPAAVVRLFLASFNAGNTDAAAATQTDDVAIVDEFAPFRWGGAGAFGRWLTALTAHDEAGGVTDGHMEMGDIVRTEVAGGAEYVHALIRQPSASLRSANVMCAGASMGTPFSLKLYTVRTTR